MTAAGKDSTSGHWELTGVIIGKPFPVFPEGFPAAAVRALVTATGRAFLGNKTASGTVILEEFGEEHLRTGALILYTSADSVCQIAAHTDVVPAPELYRIGAAARRVMVGEYGVARVIVRPFEGAPGAFRRINAGRRDYSLEPPAPTLLDYLSAAGIPVKGVGKVDDLFAGRGVGPCEHYPGNARGIGLLSEYIAAGGAGLVFANLNDFDTVYGHRNDAEGYARALEDFDAALPTLDAKFRRTDLVMITSDHGNDPTTPSTDHSREYTPLLVYYQDYDGATDLGTRDTMADVGQTAAEVLGVGPLAAGESFFHELF